MRTKAHAGRSPSSAAIHVAQRTLYHAIHNNGVQQDNERRQKPSHHARSPIHTARADASPRIRIGDLFVPTHCYLSRISFLPCRYTMLATQTVSVRPPFLGMRVSNTTNVQRQGRVGMRIRAEEGADKQSAAKASPAALRYGMGVVASFGRHVVGRRDWEYGEFSPIDRHTCRLPSCIVMYIFLHAVLALVLCAQTGARSFPLALLHTRSDTHARHRAEFTSVEAIQGEVDRLRAEMFTMRIKFAKREEYQPAQYRALRKRVAQLLTIQRERSVEEGVTLREARAAEKRKMVEAGLRQF
jgi:ribosomal protein L29